MGREGTQAQSGKQAGDLLIAVAGVGPLLERDYWAVIRDCRVSPTELMAEVSRTFEAYAPKSVAVFSRESGVGVPLREDDILGVHIKGAGHFRVRVIHVSPQSLTLGTVKGHPEAGRITFGAYRNARRDVIFHIRSRARSGSRWRYFGFVGAGEALQTRCWTDFVNRVAVAFGDGVVGWVNAETRVRRDEPDERATCTPTYYAEGD